MARPTKYCKLPELEAFDYEPPKSLKTGFLGLNANIIKPEQPELLIIKTIQGLLSAVNRELKTLDKLTPVTPMNYLRNLWIGQVLEDISIIKKTTLSELRKVFE